MSETKDLIKVLEKQFEIVVAQRIEDLKKNERMKKTGRFQQEQLEKIKAMLGQGTPPNQETQVATAPTSNVRFNPFDPTTTDLWSDYWSRLCTFCKAICISDQRRAGVTYEQASDGLQTAEESHSTEKTG